jgi:hypothetical protein
VSRRGQNCIGVTTGSGLLKHQSKRSLLESTPPSGPTPFLSTNACWGCTLVGGISNRIRSIYWHQFLYSLLVQASISTLCTTISCSWRRLCNAAQSNGYLHHFFFARTFPAISVTRSIYQDEINCCRLYEICFKKPRDNRLTSVGFSMQCLRGKGTVSMFLCGRRYTTSRRMLSSIELSPKEMGLNPDSLWTLCYW